MTKEKEAAWNWATALAGRPGLLAQYGRRDDEDGHIRAYWPREDLADWFHRHCVHHNLPLGPDYPRPSASAGPGVQALPGPAMDQWRLAREEQKRDLLQEKKDLENQRQALNQEKLDLEKGWVELAKERAALEQEKMLRADGPPDGGPWGSQNKKLKGRIDDIEEQMRTLQKENEALMRILEKRRSDSRSWSSWDWHAWNKWTEKDSDAWWTQKDWDDYKWT